MNSHKNARLTYVRRIEMVRDITQRAMSVPQAAFAHGVSSPTARKWLGRYLGDGEAGLGDASSRPAHSPRAIEPSKALAIVELRHRRLPHARAAPAVWGFQSTLNRGPRPAGFFLLRHPVPAPPLLRVEDEQPGRQLRLA